MCGRFTQAYTWREIHDFLNIFRLPRNLRARYNIAPTMDVDVVTAHDGGRTLNANALGSVPFMVEEHARRSPIVVQRAGGNRGGKANVPRSVHADPMRRSGVRLLRMESRRRQAVLLHFGDRRLDSSYRRTVG